MSIETPQVEETTPVVTKPVEATTEAPVETPAAAAATTETPAETVKESEPTTAVPEPAKDETVVEATPATEGTLGYKEPGFLKQFRFVKHFFWFSEEPISAEALNNYIKAEKPEVAHSNAAWAQETGKGVMFYSKRAEDKTHPTGLILLHDATNVTKVGFSEFSFKIGSHTHKFEATNSKERDSWIVAVEKIVSESKDLKEDITGRESYKKTIEGYSFSPVVAGAATTAPKKSLDATPAAATEETPAEAAATDAAPVDETKKIKDAEKAKKERSQSRKRNSVFGIFGKKDDDKELKKEEKAEKKAEKEHIKEEKAEEKAEKKAEKEEAKEEKKLEAEHKKEEAKAEHDASKAKEAAEAAAVAAVPASVAVAAEKHEEKKEEKHDDKSADESSPTSPTEKKSKRASVFGSLFQKSKVASPSAEKTEKDAGPAVPAKDTEVPPVSETAPVIDEPIDTKPIDTAAVTAPVDAAIAAPAATEAPKDTTPAPVAAESATTPKTEKKGFLAGLIKKPAEKREEKKEEKAAEEIAKDPVAAAAVTDNTTTEPATDAAVKESEAPKDERPAREKRRTSLFGSLGTLKRKGDKSPAPESAAAEGTEPEVKDTKREKSPIPKLGGLFRKPSRAVKSEKPVEETKTDAPVLDAAKTETEAPKAEGEAAAQEGGITVVEPQSEETKIVGDVVPDELHATVHDAVTTTPAEVKATA